jgi:predicted metalloprotease with PDZ domain
VIVMKRPAVAAAALTAVTISMTASLPLARTLEPIVYTVRVPAPETHYIEVQAAVPTGGRTAIEVMMPVWSPGYYRVENYADRVDQVNARTSAGKPLDLEKTQKNRWRIQTNGQPSVVLSYRVFCNQRSVTTNSVDVGYGVLNGAPTFITLVEQVRRPHEVRLELPAGWKRAMTGLADAPDRKPNHFRAEDYETLVDSPILAGDLGVRAFDVAGKQHYVVSAGDVSGWDAEAATRDLATYVEEVYRFWGFLPYGKYDFLLVFRQGGGGLEHKNSTLSTVSARPGGRGGANGANTTTPATSAPSRDARPASRMWPGIGLLSHEYFHLFNVKRLRPVELGPFDFEKPPTTGSLWIAEGVTSYYAGLLMERAGLRTRDEYLASLSSLIGGLQNAPGRLLQSLEQSSLEVWNNSNSGVNPSASTVSYYNKGQVLGLLLDARIRRLTEGRRSFDDVMRLAYERYSGSRGFASDQFRATAGQVAGTDLGEWFRTSVSTTQELDYDELLNWYGLRFTTSDGSPGQWTLVARSDATDAQKRHLEAWLGRSRR